MRKGGYEIGEEILLNPRLKLCSGNKVIGTVTKRLDDGRYYVRALGVTLILNGGDMRTPRGGGDSQAGILVERVGKSIREAQTALQALIDLNTGQGWERVVANHLDDCLEWIEIKTFKKF